MNSPNQCGKAQHSTRWPEWLLERLACPVCKGDLNSSLGRCQQCGVAFPKHADGILNLNPSNTFLQNDSTDWLGRQQHFREWLNNQNAIQKETELVFYRKAVSSFAPFSGHVLDVGGGDGIAFQFATGNRGYVALDPEVSLLRNMEGVVGIAGVAEFLPFKSKSFEVVLCLATLNHTSSPEMAVREMLRVLSPGGTMLIGYEEEPAVLECLRAAEWRAFRRAVYERVASLVSPKPQPDHIRVRRRDVHNWLEPLMRREQTVFTTSRGVLEIVECWRKPAA